MGKGYHIVNVFTATPKQKFLVWQQEPLTTFPTIHKALTENVYYYTSKCLVIGGLLVQCHGKKCSLLLVCQEYAVQQCAELIVGS